MHAQLLVEKAQGHGADPLHLEEMERTQCQMEIRHRGRLVINIRNVQVIFDCGKFGMEMDNHTQISI